MGAFLYENWELKLKLFRGFRKIYDGFVENSFESFLSGQNFIWSLIVIQFGKGN